MIVNRSSIFIKKLLLKAGIILLAVYILLLGIGLSYSDNLIFLPQATSYQYTNDLISIASRTAGKKGVHSIVARYLHNPNADYTIIYSHGNAVDIGGLTRLQRKFYRHGYSIIIYDYSGYGLSNGDVSEAQVFNDVKATYDYLITEQDLNANKIISYGHSLGAAVATELAHTRPVAALILESPFVSAFRVKTVYQIVPFDKFSSIDIIDMIDTPVLITHSRDDNVIPFWHGKSLYDKAAQPKNKLWLDAEGHSGITHNERFWTVLNDFTARLVATQP